MVVRKTLKVHEVHPLILQNGVWYYVIPLVSKEPLSQFEELKSKMHPLFVLLLFLNKVHKSAMMVEK